MAIASVFEWFMNQMDGTWEHATCNIGFNPKAWEVMFVSARNESLGQSGCLYAGMPPFLYGSR